MVSSRRHQHHRQHKQAQIGTERHKSNSAISSVASLHSPQQGLAVELRPTLHPLGRHLGAVRENTTHLNAHIPTHE